MSQQRALPSELYVISADNRDRFIQKLQITLSLLSSQTSFTQVIYQSHIDFHSSDNYRMAIVAENALDLTAKITQVLNADGDDSSSFSSINDVFFDKGNMAGEIGMLFPGQGSQSLYMGRDLATHFGVCQRIWQQHNDLGENFTLAEVVFPISVDTENQGKILTNNLTNTRFAQPAIVAHSVAIYQLLQQMNLRPSAVAGHSLGELPALHVAGAIDESSLFKLVNARARCMEQSANLQAPSGMTAIIHDIKESQRLIKKTAIPVQIANFNSPKQLVVSGLIRDLEQLEEVLADHEITFLRLATSAAFHTPAMGQHIQPFVAELQQLDKIVPKIPVYANLSGKPYTDDTDANRELLVNQIMHPVLFVDQILAMYQQGVRIFLEVGPGQVLSGLARKILADKTDITVLSTYQYSVNEVTSLWRALAVLAVKGVPLDLAPHWHDFADICSGV